MNALVSLLKNWTLPIAIFVGCGSYLSYHFLPCLQPVGDVVGAVVDVAFPLFIFLTLFFTFCKVDYRLLRPHRWHLWVMLTQMTAVALVLWLALEAGDSESKTLWEGVLTCVIAPCAAAAPVVAGKLGGNLNTITTYVLMSNVLSTPLIPAVFALLEPSAGVSFLAAFWTILQKVTLVLLLPLLLGYLVQQHLEPLRRWIVARKDLSFYSWTVALSMTTGFTVRNMLAAGASSTLLLPIALLSLLVCWMQFGIGRAIGHRFGEKANTGQAMFQKNTGLAIWVAYLYLNPVASAGAGCYVLWQNIINSLELWQSRVKNA